MFPECHRHRVTWLSTRVSVGLGITLGVLTSWTLAYRSSAWAQAGLDEQVSDDRRLPESGLESLLLSAEPPQRARGERFDDFRFDQPEVSVSTVGSEPTGAASKGELSAVSPASDALPEAKRPKRASFAALTRATSCDGVSIILGAEVANPWRSLPDPCELGGAGPSTRSSTPVRPHAAQRWALGALDIVDPWYGSARGARPLPLDVLVARARARAS